MEKERPLTVERIDFLIFDNLKQIENIKKQCADSVCKTEEIINRLRIKRIEIEGEK